MNEKVTLLCGVLAVAALAVPAPPVQAGWSVGVRVGFPGPYYCGPRYYGGYYGGYCGGGYCGYRPYPLVVGVGLLPPPVVVAPAPVLVQPVQPVYAVPSAAPAPAALPAPTPLPASVSHAPIATTGGDVDRYLHQLQHTDARERAEAAVQLGRLRATETVATLTATLNNDRSPQVRDAAARGLGLLGSQEALSALQKAAQSDDDRDVRRSASYAADIIRASLSRPQ